MNMSLILTLIFITTFCNASNHAFALKLGEKIILRNNVGILDVGLINEWNDYNFSSIALGIIPMSEEFDFEYKTYEIKEILPIIISQKLFPLVHNKRAEVFNPNIEGDIVLQYRRSKYLHDFATYWPVEYDQNYKDYTKNHLSYSLYFWLGNEILHKKDFCWFSFNISLGILLFSDPPSLGSYDKSGKLRDMLNCKFEIIRYKK